MQTTYDAVIHADHVEWPDGAPDLSQPVRARVTVLDEAPPVSRGAEMVAALEAIAALDPYRDIDDPVAWQREIRKDRPLPGRDEEL